MVLVHGNIFVVEWDRISTRLDKQQIPFVVLRRNNVDVVQREYGKDIFKMGKSNAMSNEV